MNKREIDDALKKISQGDNNAFERLYKETARGVYAFLFAYLCNEQDCEDAVQTTFLKIKQNINAYKAGSNGLAWILQIAKNVALNEIRSKNNYEKQKRANISEERTERIDTETKNVLMSVMKRTLDEQERQIVVLHVVWGYKHKEIAEMTGCPVGTVTSKYKRATDKLKKACKEERL